MKKANNKLDSAIILDNFEALCKKHKLDTAVLVIEHDSKKIDKDTKSVNLILGVHSKNKKKEQAILAPLGDFFRIACLNPSILSVAATFMKQETKKLDLHAREKKLSKSDKMKLKEIRSEKNELCSSGKYEKASRMREKELKFLGYKPEKSEETLFDSDFKPSIEDLEKVTNDLLEKMKGLEFNGPKEK